MNYKQLLQLEENYNWNNKIKQFEVIVSGNIIALYDAIINAEDGTIKAQTATPHGYYGNILIYADKIDAVIFPDYIVEKDKI